MADFTDALALQPSPSGTPAPEAGVPPLAASQPPGLMPNAALMIPPEDKVLFNDAISMAKKQAGRDEATVKYFVNLFRNGQFKEGEGASANFTYSDVTLLMAVLFARDPNIVVTPQNVGDLPAFLPLVQQGMFPDPSEAHEKYGEILEKVETFNWRDTKTAEHINATLFNSLVTGMGPVKISFDQDKQCSRVDTLNRDEVFVDPGARISTTQAEYIIQRCVMPIARAKDFFAKIGAQLPDLKPNYKLSQGDSLLADMAKKNSPEGGPDRYYRFYEIWYKKPDGSRVIYYRDYDKEEYLHQCPWPFILGSDEFPYSFLIMNQQFQQVNDAFTELLTINGVRIAYENIIEFYRSHVFKCITSKLFYDKTCFPDDDFDAVLDSEDMKSIGVNLGGRTIDDVIKKVSFTADANEIIELSHNLKTIKDEIFGISDIQRGASSSAKTAKEAGILDTWGKARVTRRQMILDAFLEDVLIKRTKIDLLLQPGEKTAKIVGPMGQLLWDMFDGDGEELRCLYSITVAAGSTGSDAHDEEIQSLERCFKLFEAVNQTSPMPIFNTVKLAQEMLKRYNLPHPERFIMQPAPLPKPPVSGPGGGPPPPHGAPPANNNSNNQGPHGAPPTGAPPMQTLPNESEPGAPPVAPQ